VGNKLVEATFEIEWRLFSVILALAKERSPAVHRLVALRDFTHPSKKACESWTFYDITWGEGTSLYCTGL